ncbi:unnamed protein product [Amoebophrya sp. A120]|nr:unnamed protein product [Amoebophrya sp. A120]|eukprot:GSA120T00020435001.1
MGIESECLLEPVNVFDWYKKHEAEFAPPICNRLMHKNQMTVMFVGGPNKRRDFHLDRGSEFFYQLKGNMKLPIILPNKQLEIVEINEGQVFLLPSCIPHSPQRPEEGSLGLVVERERYEDEVDGLRYFVGFDFLKHEKNLEALKIDEILWERFFNCRSLKEDLAPVVKAFLSSEECAKNDPRATDFQNVFSWFSDNTTSTAAPHASATANTGKKMKEATDSSQEPKFPVNQKIFSVPKPFLLADFLRENRQRLQAGESLPLFGGIVPRGATDKDGSTEANRSAEDDSAAAHDKSDHPDKEFNIKIGLPATIDLPKNGVETLVFQIEGETRLTQVGDGGGDGVGGTEVVDAITLKAGECVVLPGCSSDGAGSRCFACETDRETSVALLVQQYPRKNAEFYGY